MAALAANYHSNEKPGKKLAYNVGANKTIYQGALVCIEPTTGLSEPASDTATKLFIGVAAEPANNAGGAAGAIAGQVLKEGTFVYNLSTVAATQATVGQAVYAIDDQTVALTGNSTNHILVGYIVAFLANATQVRVRINRAVQ